jgi:hypothetical protein
MLYATWVIAVAVIQSERYGIERMGGRDLYKITSSRGAVGG